MDQVQNYKVVDPRDQMRFFGQQEYGGSSSSSFNNSEDDHAIDEKISIEKAFIK